MEDRMSCRMFDAIALGPHNCSTGVWKLELKVWLLTDGYENFFDLLKKLTNNETTMETL